jgi:hypothetical protein
VRGFLPQEWLSIAKNSEPYILAIGGKPSYKGQNHGDKNNLYGSSFVFAIRCRADLINCRLLRPKRGVTKLNRDLKKSRESGKPGRVLTQPMGESGINP